MGPDDESCKKNKQGIRERIGALSGLAGPIVVIVPLKATHADGCSREGDKKGRVPQVKKVCLFPLQRLLLSLHSTQAKMPNEYRLARIALAPAIAIFTVIYRHYLFGPPVLGGSGGVFSEEEKKFICAMALTLGLLNGILIVLRARRENRRIRRQQRHAFQNFPLRRRMYSPSPSSSMSAGQSSTALWEGAKADLEAELRPLSEASFTDDIEGRVILPDWLVEPCHAMISKDDGYLCTLMSRQGNVNNLSKYIEDNGMHPSNYGIDLPATTAFFQQHGATLNAKLHAALISS